jgi:hypothetical protein
VNVYVYSPRYLLASWGVAIFYTIFAVLLGLLALAKNGVAYNNNFSTVLRATRHLELDANTHLHEKTGADPLPKYLAKQSITLRIHVPVNNDSLESADVQQSSGREGNGLQDSFGKKP